MATTTVKFMLKFYSYKHSGEVLHPIYNWCIDLGSLRYDCSNFNECFFRLVDSPEADESNVVDLTGNSVVTKHGLRSFGKLMTEFKDFLKKTSTGETIMPFAFYLHYMEKGRTGSYLVVKFQDLYPNHPLPDSLRAQQLQHAMDLLLWDNS